MYSVEFVAVPQFRNGHQRQTLKNPARDTEPNMVLKKVALQTYKLQHPSTKMMLK